MNVIDLLTELKINNVKLSVQGNELKISAPKNTITPERKNLLVKYKKDIIDILSNIDIHEEPIKPIERTAPLSLSFSQQRLWFINQFKDGVDIGYNMPFSYRLNGKLNIGALRSAFQMIVQRHESLRTSFQSLDGEAVQVITDELQLEIPVYDITEVEISKYTTNNADYVFDLTTAPLIKVSLLRLSPLEHILLINMHHIISDGWSIGVFNHELTTLYAAYIKGKDSPLPPLSIQYADFAHWQRQWLQGEILERQIKYWKGQLTGAPALLELPTDRRRPITQTFRGDYYTFDLPVQLTYQLNQLSRTESVTLFILLLTGFNILLSRYSGQDDICVGIPIANRRRAELEGIIGFFVNTLVLRNKVKVKKSFKELLHHVKNTALAAYNHQDIPFEQLVEVLQPERSMSYSPLFQVMFVLQNLGKDNIELPELTVTPVEGSSHTAKFDLTLFLMETEKSIEIAVEYNTDLFDKVTIEHFVHHYQNLLEGIVANPEMRLFELPLLSESESQEILYQWNDTEESYPQDKCIHELFETQVEQTPDAIVIVYKDRQLTYRELNNKSNQLSHYLIEHGVSPDIKVGICMERSLEMVIGIIGILKAGGAYVPIDPDYPQQRIEYMLVDSGILLLLTQTSLLHLLLVNKNIKNFCIDSDWLEIKRNSLVNPKTPIRPSNLAYMIYTSGSTGKPKGVMCIHEGLVNRIDWMQKTYKLTENDHILQKTPFSFDVSVWEFFWPLTSGAQLHFAKPGGHKDPNYLAQIINEKSITTLHFVPSMLEAFISGKPKGEFKNMKRVICSGEALSAVLQTNFFEFFDKTELHNLYGPTEASIDVSFFKCSKCLQYNSVPIGRSIANTQLYILDSYLNPVARGVAGELYIGGINLARGYYNKSELTAERFSPAPFNNTPGERLYRTGDLVRHLADGNIEYIGRTDFQVKIRGLRIELGEIENVLLQQPEVDKVIVVAYTRDHGQQDTYLVAYMVLNETAEQNKELFRKTLLAILPEYMVPTFFIFLDEIPLTPNGKTNRKALPIPDVSVLQTQKYVAPSTEAEEKLAEIWSEVLNVSAEKIGVHNSFFELGGHSISVIRVISLCHKRGFYFTVKDVFEQLTIHNLTALHEKKSRKKEEITSIETEISLADEITASNQIATKPARSILLTGATGFIGAHLLNELLRSTTARIHCIIRADSRKKAEIRIKQSMKQYGLDNDSQFTRIVPVVGDLSRPLLDLTQEEFDSLSNEIDVIYHNGAWVNHIYPYDALKAANVDGTREILRLAACNKIKPMHFVSVMANAYLQDKVPKELFHASGLGYTLSKYVSEKIVYLARDRGMPVTTYRIGMISGNSSTGASNLKDRICLLIKGIIKLKCAPDVEDLSTICTPSLTPVDYLTKAIVTLSQRSDYAGHTFHLDNPHVMQWAELLEGLREYGYDLDILSLEQWKKKLTDAVAKSKDELYEKLMGLYVKENDDDPFQRLIFVSKADEYTPIGITELGSDYPVINRKLIKRYLDYFIASGFTLKPERQLPTKNKIPSVVAY